MKMTKSTRTREGAATSLNIFAIVNASISRWLSVNLFHQRYQRALESWGFRLRID